MHYHRAVFTVLGFVYREFSRAVVAELLAHAFAVHISQAIAQNSAWIPVAPNAVRLSFAIKAVLPKSFACHLAAHAVGVKTAAYAKSWIAVA